eukprot:6181977-Pleurochrysis_carterae.AAC.1
MWAIQRERAREDVKDRTRETGRCSGCRRMAHVDVDRRHAREQLFGSKAPPSLGEYESAHAESPKSAGQAPNALGQESSSRVSVSLCACVHARLHPRKRGARAMSVCSACSGGARTNPARTTPPSSSALPMRTVQPSPAARLSERRLSWPVAVLSRKQGAHAPPDAGTTRSLASTCDSKPTRGARRSTGVSLPSR